MVIVILNVIVIDTVIAEAIAEVADLARVKSHTMWVFEGGYHRYVRCPASSSGSSMTICVMRWIGPVSQGCCKRDSITCSFV